MSNESSRRPVQLHVSHDLGGGSNKWLTDYCRADTLRTNLVLRSFSHDAAMGAGLALYADAFAETPLRAWKFAQKIDAAVTAHAEYGAALREIREAHGIQALIVSSVIGHSLEVLDTGLPTLLVCHDYFPWCPAINLYYDGVCGHCDAERIEGCHRRNPDYNPFPAWGPEDRAAVRERFVELARRPHLRIVVPSPSVARNFKRIEPRFGDLEIAVIAHGYGEPLRRLDLGSMRRGERLRVLVPGQVSIAKGLKLLQAAVPKITEFADVHFLGTGELGECFKYLPHVQVRSAYEIRDLPIHVANVRPHVAVLASVVSETFGYALSELLMMGIPVAATDVGAYHDRIRNGIDGYLYEPQASALVSLLSLLDIDRDSLDRVRSELGKLRHRTAVDMVEDYHRLVPLRGASGVTAATPSAAQRAEAAEAVTIAAMWKQVRSASLQAAVVNEERQRSELRWIAERHKHQDDMARLRDELDRARQRLNHAELQLQDVTTRLQGKLAEIYASTSWRVSRPVRWFGNSFPALRSTWRSVDPVERPPQEDEGVVQRTSDDTRAGAWKRYLKAFEQEVRPRLVESVAALARKPRISLVMPTYNTPEAALRQVLDSVVAQIYPEWELCVADDGSSEPHVRAILDQYAKRDKRIRVRYGEANAGVSHASNRALESATGEFVVLLDHDDVLAEQALLRFAEAILADAPDVAYGDEILVSADGKAVLRYAYRPAFSLEYLRSHPYIVHPVGFSAALLREIGGWDESLRISQDYDLILRACEKARRVAHIPEVLYRWRIHEASAGTGKQAEVMDASKGVLRRHLERSGVAAAVEDGPSFNLFSVRYPLREGLKVAIVIPTKNHGELVRQCINSLRRTIRKAAYDIVVVDHESDDPATVAYLESIAGSVQVLKYAGPFNFGAINNSAVNRLGPGYTHILLCNNDIEALEEGWLERMLEVGQQPGVGIVGAKLFYPDGKTIQHAGVCVGMFGAAEHYGKRLKFPDEAVEPGYAEMLSLNHEVAAVTAACMLVAREAWAEVRGFDEAIAVGFGDIDLCLRITAGGWRVLMCPQAELLHHESFTRGVSASDPHPIDTSLFRVKWRDVLEAGDPYYSPGLSLASTRWDIRLPIPCQVEVRRRIVHLDPGSARVRVSYSPPASRRLFEDSEPVERQA